MVLGFGVWGIGVMCIQSLTVPVFVFGFWGLGLRGNVYRCSSISHSFSFCLLGCWVLGFGALGVWVYVLHDPIHYHSDYLGFLGLGFWGYVRRSPAGTIILRLRRRMILSLGL